MLNYFGPLFVAVLIYASMAGLGIAWVVSRLVASFGEQSRSVAATMLSVLIALAMAVIAVSLGTDVLLPNITMLVGSHS